MSPKLAVDGGQPVRSSTLPYGRQTVDEADIEAVVAVLRSAWLTTGPKVAEFERAFAQVTGAAEAVAVNSGTAALHAAMHAAGIGPGDEVIVPTITFAATANAAVFQGAVPVFADVDPETLLLTAEKARPHLTAKTRAIVAVDYAGQPCDYEPLERLAKDIGATLIADACHSLGGTDHVRPVGTLARMSAFSFHPVKPITTGEGGMVTTDDHNLAATMRRFRSHGIRTDFREREARATHFYEMVELGYNYRLTDIQCALGLTQISRLPEWVARRQEIARYYDGAFESLPWAESLAARMDATHAYHLYVLRLRLETLRADRDAIFRALRAEGIGANVHYVPVHLHPFYRENYGTTAGSCPEAEAAYKRILSLPIFPGMTDADAADVVAAVHKVLEAYSL